MRRHRNFGFPAASSAVRSSSSAAAAVFNKGATNPTARATVDRTVNVNPIIAETAKVISNNKQISDVERQKELQKVIAKPVPIKEQPKQIITRPPSFKPAPSPPAVYVPPKDPDADRIREEEERLRKEEETRRKEEEALKAAEEADRQQQQPPAKPTPTPPSTPSPPVAVTPSPPRTSIRMPTAIPRTYSRNMRVSFRAPRLMLPKPTMRKLQPRPTKQKWNAMNPTYPSFMNPVKHGQFSFQNRGRSLARNNVHTHSEIRKLQNQVNKLNADALKTREDSMRERNALQSKLRDYELSPVMQVRNHAKGVFSIVDDASKFATPSVNGMHGFPSVGEGPSKALAVGFGLLTALFIIGRVE